MNSVFEKERFMLVFALVIVVSILIIVGLLVFFPIPSENKDTLIQVIGTLTGAFVTIRGLLLRELEVECR